MSTLQISLAVAGGLVLAAVVAHSAWSARRNLPRQPLPESQAADSPREAVEAADAVDSVGDRDHDSPDQRKEPSFEPDSELGALASLMAPEKKPGLDALIDVIAPVAMDALVSGEAAQAAMPTTRRVGSKPFAVEGLGVLSGQWETPAAGQRYSAFQCGVQLANRVGALNQIEYSEFVMKTQAFSDAIGGEPEFPEMTDEVARARELDQFASAHDAQLSFTIRAQRTAWSPGYVQQTAARLGFVAGSMPGRMVLPAGQLDGGTSGSPILGLAFDPQAAMAEDPEQTALREVSLSLDVPQVGRSEQPFLRMREAAGALAASMDGVVMDDNGQPIPDAAMDVISGDLEQLYNTLDSRDLSAGSALAKRLFS